MRNIVSRIRIKPMSLVFRAGVLSLHHIGSLISPLYPRLPVYVALASEVSADYYNMVAVI